MQVPLGVIPKNENKNDEMHMCTILGQIHDFAPCKMWTAENIVLAISKAKAFHQFLVGGDQMIAARCCSTRCDNDTRRAHLHGSHNCFNI